jgi:hypothetical protein
MVQPLAPLSWLYQNHRAPRFSRRAASFSYRLVPVWADTEVSCASACNQSPSPEQLGTPIATSNPTARFAVYSKLEAQLQQDLPYIALYQQDYCTALSKDFAVPRFNELAFMFDDYALQIKLAHRFSGSSGPR